MARNTSGLLRGGPGRPPGVPNKVTRLVRDFAQELINSSSYTRYLAHRIERGQAPQIELYFWQLCGGKPKESLEVSGAINLPVRVVHEYQTLAGESLPALPPGESPQNSEQISPESDKQSSVNLANSLIVETITASRQTDSETE